MDWSLRPVHAPGIGIRPAPDGLVVYDAARDRLHYARGESLAPDDVCIQAKRALAEGRARDE